MSRTLPAWLQAAPLGILVACASTPQAPQEPTADEKIARILKLEDERSTGDGELVARLSDPAGLVRARAAIALGRVEATDAVSSLVPMLEDSSPYVRRSAAFALGQLGSPLADSTLVALTGALGDEDERVRAHAIEALGKKGGDREAEAIATSLIETMPTGGEPYVWRDDMSRANANAERTELRAGLFALTRLGNLRWSWPVVSTEGSTPRFEWWPAAYAASRLGGDQRAPLMRYYVLSPDPTYRLWGAEGLRDLNAEGVSEHVELLLTDSNEKVRIAAIRAAASLGTSVFARKLLPLLEQDTHYVQAAVLDALSRFDAPGTLDTIVDRLGDESPWMRALALPALARQDPDGFWLLLAGLGEDRDWTVRAALADLLGRMDGARPVELLLAMCEDEDARVRARALAAFARVDGDRAAPVLVQHLTADDPYERLAAARAIARLGYADGAAPVEQAFLSTTDEDGRAKRGLLEALATLSPERARGVALQAVGDESYLVRRLAVSLLRRQMDDPPALRPRESVRALSDYRPFVSPRFTPQAFIRTNRGTTIELELLVVDAPLTVENFIRLAREGFYDGLTVHRVVPNGYVETGDPRGDGHGGPGYTIRTEISEHPILRGSVAMAADERDTEGSRFFITHLPRPDLTGRYTVFAQVTSGMETVDRLEPGDRIESITIWDGVNSPYRDP